MCIYIYCLLPIAYVPLRRLAVDTGMWKLWRLLRWLELLNISSEKLTVYETWSRDVVVFTTVFF